MHGQRILVFGAACALAIGQAARADSTAPRFNRDVRPILAEHCYPCHGPDARQRKAGLRFDVRDAAVAKGAITPGDTAGSLLLERVRSADPDQQMPPPSTKRSLSAAQIAVLDRWIAGGAEYEIHWSLIPPARVVPVPAGETPGGNPIDRFIGARLKAEGIAPSPPADRETLLRRATLDLTGLPPTLEELDVFLADPAPDAYERAVDRLLASPAYGERMANEWLDVARYADTYGYQADRSNNVWPWRDWVIRAFNENLSYRDFIAWQVAGDLLPNATQDQMLATAFNRLHRQTNEGGSVLEEFRQEYVADRVKTFSTAFLGLSMECSRCHDHKFDPVTQREYYQLSAFFDNIDESGMYSFYTDAVPSPSMLMYKPGEQEQHAAKRGAVAQAEARARQAQSDAKAKCDAWLAELHPAIKIPDPAMYLPLDEIAGGKTPETAGKREASYSEGATPVDGRKGKALKFSGDFALEVKGAGLYHRYDPFTVAAWIKTPAIAPHEVVLHCTKAREDAGSRGWELTLEDGKPAFSLVHFWPGNAIQVQCEAPIAVDTWTHVLVSYDGSSRADGVAIYIDGQRAPSRAVRDHLFKDITYEREAPDGLSLAARGRDNGFKDGGIDEVMLFDRALTEYEAADVAGAQPLAAQVERASLQTRTDAAALAYFASHFDAPAKDALAALHDARKAEGEFVQAVPEMMVMKEMSPRRATHVLNRGAYDAPGGPVEPGTPGCLPPMPKEAPSDRLGLAQWLLDDDHPLTARVAVNRYWQLFFGRGLVETQEDFGTQGRPPSHPELLDWLARWFIESGWDVKGLNKLIVTSATYRQSSRAREELRARDPYNVLLARAPAQRLSAEAIRDEALAASGLLVRTLGGPSVKPYQPAGLWEDSAWDSYKQDHGEALYRRSMYTYWKRTIPPPTMLTFDATSRETCIARRENTQTPLQSLALLNDPGFVEAARVLAARAMKSPGDAGTHISTAFRMVTGRKPNANEQRILMAAYDEQRGNFVADAAAAEKYIATGEAPKAGDTSAPDLAALTAIVQAILNLDEAQMKS